MVKLLQLNETVTLRGPMSKHSQDAKACRMKKRMRMLEKKIAHLESLHDVYETQRDQLESLLQSVGFENGIQSVHEAASELLMCEMDDE